MFHPTEGLSIILPEETEVSVFLPTAIRGINFLELRSAPQIALSSEDLSVAGCWNCKMSQEHTQKWLLAGLGHMNISWRDSGDTYHKLFLAEGATQRP